MDHLAHLLGTGHLAAGRPACQAKALTLEGANQVTSAEGFVEFVEAVYPQLRRTAFLLCGDWGNAEDLAQTALEKVFVSWHKIRQQDSVHAYTHRTLVNSYLAHKRLKRTGELLTAWFPERAIEAPAPETRIMALDALATLPPRTRAVVVLRYWADLSVEQVADVLGCSPGNVKRLSAYAKDRLRTVLGDEMTASSSSGRAGTEQGARKSTPHG
jgi:RNA polymerase sigma-70 factor (sigma-E family)